MNRTLLVLGLAVSAAFPRVSSAEDPFALNGKRDPVLAGGCAAVCLIGWAVVSSPAPVYTGSLDRNRIFAPDRFAVDLRSRGFASASDAFMVAGAGMPLALTSRKHFTADLVMTLESTLLCEGITNLCKGIVARPRPYAYRPEYQGRPLEKDAFRSFFSGHTSAAFNGAVMAAVLYQKRHPHSKSATAVWVTGLSLASATGACRVLSGNHFPTDVAVGALAGAFTGWLIPQLHFMHHGGP
jgi:membrane-associated phospholipid phosphatase